MTEDNLERRREENINYFGTFRSPKFGKNLGNVNHCEFGNNKTLHLECGNEPMGTYGLGTWEHTIGHHW